MLARWKIRRQNTIEIFDFEQIQWDNYAQFLQSRLRLKILKRKKIYRLPLQQGHL